MNTNKVNDGDPILTQLLERVELALAERDHGFLTQREFRDRLTEITIELGVDRQLEQHESRGGDTKFLVRCRNTGQLIDLFQLRRRFS